MRIFACLAVFASLSLPVFGQFAGSIVSTTGGPNEIHGRMGFQGPRYRGPAVVGAPYSAQHVTEQVMVGSDGTRFTNSNFQETTYRDSQGRTRTERTGMGPNPQNFEAPVIVEISDPTAGFDYVLDTQHKIAHRIQHTATPPGRFARNAQLAPAGATPTAAAPAAGTAGTFAVGGGPGLLVSTNTIPAGAGPVPPPPPPNGVAVAGMLGVTAPGQTTAATLPARASSLRPEIRHEELGEQMIEGVMAKGTRTTQTWPTGAQGNDRPFQTVNETWFSESIKEVVLAKNTNPRNGEFTTKLTHIDTSEQPISLFQPPADYSVVDETGSFQIEWTATAKQ